MYLNFYIVLRQITRRFLHKNFKFIAELGAEFYYPIAHVVNWNIGKNRLFDVFLLTSMGPMSAIFQIFFQEILQFWCGFFYKTPREIGQVAM